MASPEGEALLRALADFIDSRPMPGAEPSYTPPEASYTPSEPPMATTAEPLTDRQGKTIYAICASHKVDQYEVCRQVLGVHVTDTRNLTKTQASKVIDYLTKRYPR